MSDDTTRLEEDLRHALRVEAASVQPRDRLGQILREAHEPFLSGLDGEGDPMRPQRRPAWLAGAAAAAAVVAAVTVGTVVNDRKEPVTPGTSSSAAPTTGSTGSTGGPSATATGTTGGTSGPALASATVAVPVYYLGHEVGATGRVALVREFTAVPAEGATTESRLVSAVDALLTAKDTGYTPGWEVGTDARAPRVTATGIALQIHTGHATRPPTHEAVAAIVLTAQAVVGRGDLPVTVTPVDGGSASAPRPLGTFTHADVADVPLASIWVDEPSRGQRYAAGRTVTLKGIASVFEASLSWELTRAGAVVSSGHTTAAGGAPARAAYGVDLGTLPAGGYIVTVRAFSAKDGSVAAERSMPFTVD